MKCEKTVILKNIEECLLIAQNINAQIKWKGKIFEKIRRNLMKGYPIAY